MNISDIKSMNEADERVFWTKATAKQLREILNNENLGGGISSWNKETLTRAISDLIEGVESDLVKKLKPKRVTKKNKVNNEQKQLTDDKLNNIKKAEFNIQEDNPYDMGTDEYFDFEIAKLDNTMMTKEELQSEDNLYTEMMKDTHKSQTGMLWYHVDSQANFFDRIEYMRELDPKKTYRKMVKYFHPDNQNTGNEEKFMNVDLAWKEYCKIEKGEIF